MRYLAFLPSDDVDLTIEGAKYPLNKDNFFFKKVYTSNEFIDRPIYLDFDSGYTVIIYSKDRSWYGVYNYPHSFGKPSADFSPMVKA